MTGIFVLSFVLTVGGVLLWADRPALKGSALRTDNEHKFQSRLLWTKNRMWCLSLIALFALAAIASTWTVVGSADPFERQFGLVVCIMDWILLAAFAGSMFYWNFFANKNEVN